MCSSDLEVDLGGTDWCGTEVGWGGWSGGVRSSWGGYGSGVGVTTAVACGITGYNVVTVVGSPYCGGVSVGSYITGYLSDGYTTSDNVIDCYTDIVSRGSPAEVYLVVGGGGGVQARWSGWGLGVAVLDID